MMSKMRSRVAHNQSQGDLNATSNLALTSFGPIGAEIRDNYNQKAQVVNQEAQLQQFDPNQLKIKNFNQFLKYQEENNKLQENVMNPYVNQIKERAVEPISVAEYKLPSERSTDQQANLVTEESISALGLQQLNNKVTFAPPREKINTCRLPKARPQSNIKVPGWLLTPNLDMQDSMI